MLHRVVAIACFLLPAVASTATAQVITPGQRIRITAPERQLEGIRGELLRLDQDSLVLASDGQRLSLPRNIVTVETFGGRHGHALIGALIGAAAVGVAGAVEWRSNPSQCQGSGNYEAICAMALGAAVLGGALLGTLVGAVIRHDDWMPVSLDSVGLTSNRFAREPGVRPQFSVTFSLTPW